MSNTQNLIANSVYRFLITEVTIWESIELPVMSTGRNSDYYRKVLFDDVAMDQLLLNLKDQTIVDIGCGHTPYLSDSMFQLCEKNGIDFYGIDPKLDGDLRDDLYNKFLRRVTGAKGDYDPTAPGTKQRAVAGYADDLPFDDNSVDTITSSFLMYIWLQDKEILEKIMVEFDRVLKPGGSIRLYPQPSWDKLSVLYPKATEVLADYEIQQRFISSLKFTSPPAFVTTATKRSS